ncbi:MAG TPA: DNA polymerase III subunit gamma/tau [Burkholderiaceae bacterium]|nr:DNA polymerase III subunit gamma/tau [Burkholderiaceae bacterium]
MSHQVLARKWRPRDFASIVGQDHVVRALTQALRTGRLHHAYLFTGTRGVGKTTLARVLAKALNCDTGVAAEPCGRCRACTEIDAGRFTDYFEIDAASNRRVEEITPLLENAAYSPVAGRYKVYTIDEVHMLSAHAFNAMLKTLEEPPAHVVFILATTDPQKVPVTVLSRCLQFNLKNMAPAAIAAHLARVLEHEQIAFEPPALARIGRAAGGSMRDALSLLDQAIAYSGGELTDAAAAEMLGAVDSSWLERLLDALAAGDGAALVRTGDEMAAANVPFERALLDLAGLLQRIALAQVGVAPTDDDERDRLQRFAAAIDAADLQVYYQIAVHGARELSLAPDPHAGFTMTLLRLFAFRPDDGAAPGVPAAAARPAAALSRPAAAPTARAAATPVPAGRAPHPSSQTAPQPASQPGSQPASPQPRADAASPPAGAVAFDGDWVALAARGPFTGMVRQFMQQSELLSWHEDQFELRVPLKPLAESSIVAKVRDSLGQYFGRPVRLSVQLGPVGGPTAASIATAQGAEQQARAQAAIETDPFVQTLLKDFGGTIVPDSVRPQNTSGDSR